jgi:uncharacterized protein YutE (UPF0331/DUF86 family)
MVKGEIIRRRLNRLDEYLAVLRRIRRYPQAQFISDPLLFGSAERFLQLSVEALCDMGSHLIVDRTLGSIETYADIPRVLNQHQIVRDEQAEKWILMIGFRNILVHDYLEVDRGIVYEVLQNQLDDIEAIASVFARFLD